MRSLLMLFLLPVTLAAQSTPEASRAVTQALAPLQRSAGEFVAKRACVSCHHNILPILMLDLARSRGFKIDTKVLDAVEDKTFRQLRGANAVDDAIQGVNLNDPTPNDSYLLVAAHDAGMTPDLTTAVYARRLARWQQKDGHWITSDFRPPHSSSLFMATATAVRSVRAYMPEELQAERESVIRTASRWLLRTRPATTEDASFRVLGLVWAGAAAADIAAAAQDLTSMQGRNGGWSQLPGYAADAYSTGEALFALHEAGIGSATPSWANGAKFLISTQAKDGTWHVQTRMLSPAQVSPPYFTTGFPYAKDEFLSYAGTSWAVMALLSALPETAPQPAAVAPSSVDVPAWLRPALFGTAPQLAALLDRGLDVNSKTSNGTTVLMAAAADSDKVRLLVSRGADLRARAKSGADAMTIASGYRGTAASLKALLDAGAPAGPPEGVRLRHSPLALAAMSGDVDNLKLLIAAGARPLETALSEAVTFGHADIVGELLATGADAGIEDSAGINLVHWASITHRPAVIPALVKAGVPVNNPDDHGFTPLMYAATIDFGDTELVTTLLKAGADKSIKNLEGRTPLAQARRYKHTQLEPLLK